VERRKLRRFEGPLGDMVAVDDRGSWVLGEVQLSAPFALRALGATDVMGWNWKSAPSWVKMNSPVERDNRHLRLQAG
jgi:hypothetical protein